MHIFDMTLFWIHMAPSYYWLMYAMWLLSGYYMIKSSKMMEPPNPLISGNNNILDDLLMYMVMWVMLWWSLWYMLFYNFSSYMNNPLDMLKVWEGWMSFHGWMLGVTMAMMLFSKIHKMNFYKLADQMSLVVPIWLWLGSFWNYLNKELLWYSWYSWPLSVNWQFPSPLVEMMLEWLVMFIMLNYLYNKHKDKFKSWQMASMFMMLYWIFSMFVEAVFSEPDAHMWYMWNYFTLWEIYSLPMIMIWVYYFVKLSK